MYKCPHCSGSLSTQSCEGIEVEICTDCEGTWLDVNELTLLTQQAQNNPSYNKVEEDEGTIKPTEGNGEKKCPKCTDIDLNAFIYGGDSGIELDRCPQCEGLWFDKNELEDVTNLIADNDIVASSPDGYQKSELKMKKYVGWLSWIGSFFARGKYRRLM